MLHVGEKTCNSLLQEFILDKIIEKLINQTMYCVNNVYDIKILQTLTF